MTTVDDHHRLLLGPAAAARWHGRLDALPGPGTATAVVVGQLCHEADLDAALAQLHDRLAPDGRLVFVEHVGRPGLLGRVLAAWGARRGRRSRGCHAGRDVPAAVRKAGFFITDLERFTMPTPVPVLRSWVSGVAVPAESIR